MHANDDKATGFVRMAHIEELLEHFSHNTYSPKGGDVKGILAMDTCMMLFEKDYTFTVINNSNGELCGHYPSKIVVLEYEGSTTGAKYQTLHDRKKLDDLMRNARIARCRSRFVVPVILYNGKNICRSSTLSGWQELLGRRGIDFFFSGGAASRAGSMDGEQSVSPQAFDRYRGLDIQLLKELNVKHICDLMVEQKKVKYGINVTSSEKVDKENRYRSFTIISLPYPGCELFSDWKESNYDSENILYDWSQEYNTAELDLQNEPLLEGLSIDWQQYKEWDIVRLTQNYMLVLLQLLNHYNSGMLIHCISGWDRTPLFISLLRLSLWADGVIHKSLDPEEILYLTLAYDWYLFGHQLTDRVNKGQEVLHFCFKVLKHLEGQEFSVTTQKRLEQSHCYVPENRSQFCTKDHPHNHHRSPQHYTMDSSCSLYHVANNGSPHSRTLGKEPKQVSGCFLHKKNCIIHEESQSSPICHLHCEQCLYHTVQDSQSVDGNRAHNATDMSATEKSLLTPVVSNYFSSSPVNIPTTSKHSDHAVSPAFNSWQLISDTGSVHSVPLSNQSPIWQYRSPGCDSSAKFCHHSGQEQASSTKSVRYHRLNTVVELFENAYAKIILSKESSYNTSSALSSILGNFAEKIGLRSGPR